MATLFEWRGLMNRKIQLCTTVCGIGILFGIQPVSAETTGDAKRGDKLFVKASCANCHPGGGNIINPKVPLKGPKFAFEFKDDAKIEQVVRVGKKGTPMPSFSKAKLSDQDLKDVIAYIRTLTPKSGK